MVPPGEQRDDAVEEWRDWEEHQYLPGYYTGGRVPGWYRRRWGTPLIAVQLVGACTVVAAFLIPMVVGVANHWPPGVDVGGGLFAVILAGGTVWRIRDERRRRAHSLH